MDEAELRARVEENVVCSSYGPGFVRQLAAIIADGDRRATLHTTTVPMVVIHSTADPLIPPACGRDTAANIRARGRSSSNGWATACPPSWP